jgi:hypothetical protein
MVVGVTPGTASAGLIDASVDRMVKQTADGQRMQT